MYVSSMLHLSENLPDQIAQLLSINNKHYNIAGTCAVMGPHTQKMQGGPHIIVFVIATAYKCVQKKQNLAITNRSCVSCVHNTSKTSIMTP